MSKQKDFYLSQEEIDKKKTEAKIKALEEVQKLEDEITDLKEEMNHECDHCHPGYAVCTDHQKIMDTIADKTKLVADIKDYYGI